MFFVNAAVVRCNKNPATLAELGPGFPQRDEPLLAAASEVTLEDFEEVAKPRLPTQFNPLQD